MRQLILVAILAAAFSTMQVYTQEKTETKEAGSDAHATKMVEVSKFHELLHPLVHDAYPDSNFSAIRKALPDLIAAAASIKNAKLPKELRSKKKEFRKISKSLLKQLETMNKRKAKLSDKELGDQFMEMHDTFEKMMELIE